MFGGRVGDVKARQRLGRASCVVTTTMAPQTRTGGSSPVKLKFREKLTGKGLSTDVLLKKMRALQVELQEMDQDHVDVQSLNPVRKELISTSILLHKDRGIKAYAACCLADILRLYAPDAPYNPNELRDIFQFFFRQLSAGLTGTDAPYYEQYFHLLDSLSTVKSVVLITDLPNAEELMANTFRDIFGIVRRDLARKIEMFMVDILCALIDECPTLPQEVLEIIMAQFMDKKAHMDQPAYRLAVQVCTSTSDKLQRYVCQYFTDIIVAHPDDEQTQTEDLQTAHNLIQRLNRSCPALLHSVIPQLEEEIRLENLQVRTIATQTLGEMYGDKGAADLVRKYPSTWSVWLSRRNDRIPAVRIQFIEATGGLLTNLPEQREAIEDALQQKLFDPDEKVRAAVCRVFSSLDYETALRHVSEKTLRQVGGRFLDKKHIVRVEALTALGKLYNLAFPEIENPESPAKQQFGWIPSAMLEAFAADIQSQSVAEQALYEYIFPLPSSSPGPSTSKATDIDEVAWVDRLLIIVKYLSDKDLKTFSRVAALKINRPTVFQHFIDACIEYNGGIIDENEVAITKKLQMAIGRIARARPDVQKVTEDLNAFAKLNEGRLYKLFKTCMDTQTDIKSLAKATNEFKKRIETSSASIAPTIVSVLSRASFRVINQSTVPTLIKRLQRNDTRDGHLDGLGEQAERIFALISKLCPLLFKPHIAELTKAVSDERNPRLVDVCLQALASLARNDGKTSGHDKRTIERIKKYTLENDAKRAKFAARFLAFTPEKSETCNEITETISSGLAEADDDTLVSHLTVLNQFVQLYPESFESKSDVIVASLSRLLRQSTSPDADDMLVDEANPESTWLPDDAVPSLLQAKVIALKICRRRCLVYAQEKQKDEASKDATLLVAQPVLSILKTILETAGSANPKAEDSPGYKSRIRLQAGISILHLATAAIFGSKLSDIYQHLVLLVQDPCPEVRHTFLGKYTSICQRGQLDPKYNVIPFLTAVDPDEKTRSIAVSFLSACKVSYPPTIFLEHFELIFARLLHFLAHHPDFSPVHENLIEFVDYINFYLEMMATPNNIALLYHLALRMKTVRDKSRSATLNQHLYTIGELAQEAIKSKAHSKGWALHSYPGKLKMPMDIFEPLLSPAQSTEISHKTYLPSETITWFSDNVKGHKAISDKRSKNGQRDPAAGGSRRKRKVERKTKGSAKSSRAKRRKRDSDDDDDESSESESDEEEENEEDGQGDSKSEDNAPGNEDEDGEDEDSRPSAREMALQRGARTRAKAKIKEQSKSRRKSRPSLGSNDE